MLTLKLDELCKRADLAVRLGSNDYTIAVCQHILGILPKHTQARSLLGQALLEQGAYAKAAEQFKMVLEVDPDNVVARSALGVVYDRLGDLPAAIEQFERARQLNPRNAEVTDGLKQLYARRDGEENAATETPRQDFTAATAALARLHSTRKQYVEAAEEFEKALKAQPGRVELQLARAESLWRGGALRDAERACIQILQKAPNTLKAKLILAEIMLRDHAREKQGLALLHEALGVDPGGRLAKDLFRDTGLLVPDIGGELDFPPLDGRAITPPEVEAAIDLLPKGSPTSTEAEADALTDLDPEQTAEDIAPKAAAAPDVQRIQADLERLGNALWQAAKPQIETPQPAGTTVAEVVVTSKSRIIAKYGQDGFARLDRKLQEYSQSLGAANVDIRSLYVDDEHSVAQYGLSVVDPTNADAIKALIDNVDKNLTQNSRQMSFVLILGGDSIIPFFRLPNPAVDDDPQVLSDNPYATRDANFLVPERALGRMPDAEGGDVSLLLAQLATSMAHRHEPGAKAQPLGCLATLLSLGISVQIPQARGKSFGYSALVWKDASASAFGAINDPRNLLTCPPTTDQVFDLNWLLGSGFNYFNLHGSKDSEHWYGQKDSTYPDTYPMLPIALNPATIAKANVASSVIFSEACYGAYIIGKSVDKSIALQFLADGGLGFVGSTMTAYGVPAPPLSSADLMAVHFWHNLTAGLSLGQALAKAKVTLASEMSDRQGWLDADDQKTLLEFVLYGDPSSHFDSMPALRMKGAHEPALRHALDPKRGNYHLFCRHRVSTKADDDLDVDLIQRIVGHFHACCPEVDGGSLRVHACVSCNGQCGSQCQCGAAGLHSHDINPLQRLTLFTSRKKVRTEDGKELTKLARAAVGADGQILKTVISR